MVNFRLAFIVPASASHGPPRDCCFLGTRRAQNAHTPPLRTAKDGTDATPAPVAHVPSLPPPARPSSRKAVLSPGEIGPARERIFALLHEHFAAQCLYTVVNLGVPDVLGDETLTVREIVARICHPDVNEDLLLRQLRLLSSEDGWGLFVESSGGEDGREFAYALGPVGKLLQTGVEGQTSMACAVQHSFEPPLWAAWSKLPEATYGSIETRELAFKAANGVNVFEYYQSHPESMAPFQEFMAANSASAVEGMVAGYDWSKLEGKRVCDIGGGYGEVMHAVKKKYPGIDTMSLDLGPVVDMAPEELEGVELVRGDMFDSSTIPPDCDVAFLRHIFHDWSSEDSGRILDSLHEALPDHGKLLVVDAIMPRPGVNSPFTKVQKHVDMLMALFGGQERTLDQWTSLINAHGWNIDSVVDNTPSLNLDGIIECSKK